MFLNTDGRLTETGQISRCPAGQTVADGGREGPAADGRQFHGRYQQTTGPSRAEGMSTSAGREAIDRHLLSTSSKPAAVGLLLWARPGTARGTDRLTPYCYIDPAQHTLRAVSKNNIRQSNSNTDHHRALFRVSQIVQRFVDCGDVAPVGPSFPHDV